MCKVDINKPKQTIGLFEILNVQRKRMTDRVKARKSQPRLQVEARPNTVEYKVCSMNGER